MQKIVICVLLLLFFVQQVTAQIPAADSIRFSKELIGIEQALMDTIPSVGTHPR